MEPAIEKLETKCMDIDYATALYGALCNVIWVNKKTKEEYSCTWRYAGGLVADLRNENENYMDFYCSGNEGKVREDILNDLKAHGWEPHTYPDCDTDIIITICKT